MIYISPMRAAVLYCCDHLQRFDCEAVEYTAGTSHLSTRCYLRQLENRLVLLNEREIFSMGPRFAGWSATVPRSRPNRALADCRVYDKSRRQLLAMTIRQSLETLGRTSAWLSNQVGVERSTIFRILHCERPASHVTMERIIRALEAEHARTESGSALHPRVDDRPVGCGSGLSEGL